MKKLYSLIAVTVLAMSASCNLPGNNTSNVPAQTPGSIRGILWHEICKYSGGEAGQPLVLGQGCIQWGTAAVEFGPNQFRIRLDRRYSPSWIRSMSINRAGNSDHKCFRRISVRGIERRYVLCFVQQSYRWERQNPDPG
jgi:hypothetical protein